MTTKKKNRPPHPGESETIVARRVKALDLRKAGLTYRRIAEELKVNVRTAYTDVQDELAALKTLTGKAAEDIRELELRRLDDYTLGLTPAARRGDVRAVIALVRVQERRAKLLGIDAPTNHTMSAPGGGPIAVIERRILHGKDPQD
jgi:hypothetical protein